MEYVIPLVLVLLLVTGFVVFVTLNSAKKSRVADDAAVPGIGADDTPLGDTSEHAGTQDVSGRTVGDQDADEHGGTGRPVQGEGAVAAPGERFDRGDSAAQGIDGGAQQDQGETDTRPASERLANRPI